MNFTSWLLAFQCLVLGAFVGFVATHQVEITVWLRSVGL